MMMGLGSSDNEFDKMFAQQIKDIHGIDVNVPPLPDPSLNWCWNTMPRCNPNT